MSLRAFGRWHLYAEGLLPQEKKTARTEERYIWSRPGHTVRRDRTDKVGRCTAHRGGSDLDMHRESAASGSASMTLCWI